MIVQAVARGMIDTSEAAVRLANLGFLAYSDLPDRPGPALLLVALRDQPTLRHYDPERVDYWVTEGGRGVPRSLSRQTRLPAEINFSWGTIRLVDRLQVTNEYLTFGGHLSVAPVHGVVVAVFESPAPLLRRGGHSQGWDEGAESLGAFFGRLLVAVDFTPGCEDALGRASPLARYAAFVADLASRYRKSPSLRAEHGTLWGLLEGASARLRQVHPVDWQAGHDLLVASGWVASPT